MSHYPTTAEMAEHRRQLAESWHAEAARRHGAGSVRVFIWDAMLPHRRAWAHERELGIGAGDWWPVNMPAPDDLPDRADVYAGGAAPWCQAPAGAWWSWLLRWSSAR